MGKSTKTLTDHRGYDVPVDLIQKSDLKKDKVAFKLLSKAEKINELLESFKKESFEMADDIYTSEAEKNGIKEDAKGNFTFYSFDKSVRIEVTVSDRIEFDEHIQFAQSKINEYLKLKTNGLDNELSQIINNAFSTTRGKLDTKRIIGLFRLKIENSIWMEAMELIKKSMSSNSSKRYLSICKREENGEYKAVQLNFSAI